MEEKMCEMHENLHLVEATLALFEARFPSGGNFPEPATADSLPDEKPATCSFHEKIKAALLARAGLYELRKRIERLDAKIKTEMTEMQVDDSVVLLDGE